MSETPPTPEITDFRERFAEVGMLDFWDFYKTVQDTEYKYGSRAHGDFFNVIYNLCDRVAQGAIETDDPELLQVRDGWGEQKEHAVEAAKNHIKTISIEHDKESGDNPEDFRNNQLLKFAESFAPMAHALPKKLYLYKFGVGGTTPDSISTKSFADFEPWLAWMEFFHENTHATDIYFDRVKPYIPRQEYLTYLTKYYEVADRVLTKALSFNTPEEHYKFLLGTPYIPFGSLLALPDMKQKMGLIFDRLEPIMFNKVSNKNLVGDSIRYGNLVWAVGRELQTIHEKQSRKESLTPAEEQLLGNSDVTTLMSMALQEVLHVLVDSREEYSPSGDRYQNPEIFKAQKEMNDLRIRTFATFPLDQEKDPMKQMKEQLGFAGDSSH